MKAQAQMSISYGAKTLGSQTWERELEWARRAVNELGLKEVAYELNVQPSLLCDALNERDRKGMRGHWMAVLLAMSSDSLRRDYLAIVNGACGYRAQRVRALSPAEELRVRRAALERLAPALVAQLDAAVEQFVDMEADEPS